MERARWNQIRLLNNAQVSIFSILDIDITVSILRVC